MLRLALLFFCVAWTSAFNLKEFREELMADEDFIKAKETCLKEADMTEDQLKFDHKDPEVPKHLMCFGKCLHKERGYLDEDGKLVMSKMETLPIFNFIDDEKKTQILECLEKIDEIKECEDMMKEKECFHEFLKHD